MKKLLATTIALALILSLAACGKETTTSSTPQQSLVGSGSIDAVSSTDSEKNTEAGVYLEPVQLDEYSKGLNIYLSDAAIDNTVFTDGIFTLDGSKGSFTIDFADKVTQHGLVKEGEHFTPIVTLTEGGSTLQTALYARDKSVNGITVIELSFLGADDLADKNWGSYQKASLKRGGTTTELPILDASPISNVDTAIEVFHKEVYDKGFGARNGDSVHFVPKTNDYLILFSTDDQFGQTAYLTSFDHNKKAVQFTIREVSDWENVSNLKEVLARNDAELVDDAMYYEYDLESLSYESLLPTSEKFHCIYMAHSGGMGSRGLSGTFDFYYPQPLTDSDYKSTFENKLAADDCQITRAIPQKTDDYMVHISEQIDNPAHETTELIGREADGLTGITKPVHINDAYSYHLEEMYAWDNDGECVQYVRVAVCKSAVDADEYMKAHRYQAFDATNVTQQGQYIILNDTSSNDLPKKLFALSGEKGPAEWYMAKPYLTQSQANAAFKNAPKQ